MSNVLIIFQCVCLLETEKFAATSFLKQYLSKWNKHTYFGLNNGLNIFSYDLFLEASIWKFWVRSKWQNTHLFWVEREIKYDFVWPVSAGFHLKHFGQCYGCQNDINLTYFGLSDVLIICQYVQPLETEKFVAIWFLKLKLSKWQKFHLFWVERWIKYLLVWPLSRGFHLKILGNVKMSKTHLLLVERQIKYLFVWPVSGGFHLKSFSIVKITKNSHILGWAMD